MITKINTDIPTSVNKDIINNLYRATDWFFGSDKILNININNKDAGFTLNTTMNNHDILNTYAKVIYTMVEKDTFMKFKKIDRIYWNWYHPGSDMKFHEDDLQDNKFSIIYNLHDNDGGTEFKINNEVKFYKSEESTALLFPSKIEHRGVSPTKDLNRFSLNILIEI
tara:strand:- start:41 stop:541 length:501 start_codon:yes stop_codon:yes gene_type:complete